VIPVLGRLLVLAALLFAAFGAPVGFVAGARHSRRGLALARNAAIGFAVCIIAANLLMEVALLTNDFSVSYVAEVGSRSTPLYFKIASLWASLSGSILFWAGILGVYAGGFVWLHGRSHREYMPYALGTLLVVSVFFTFLVASVADPFKPVFPVPMDGPGPNPLLQNHWLMVLHPPMLYMGYVGMAVPFAVAAAALFAGRLEPGWMVPLRRWMLAPWAFLSVGIAMGGWWSYAVLGWGGYWAWDPVENASLLPWLTCTAALHSALVTHRRGRLKTWTLMMVFVTFLLTLFGTFLTRSGVFNSVHAFTQSEIGPVFLTFIAAMFLFSLVLLATRDHVIEGVEPLEDEGTEKMGPLLVFLRRRLGPMHPLGREFQVFLQNLVFSIFAFTVLLGTTVPLLVEAIQNKRLSVGDPYFDGMALPLGVLLVFLMAVGPALPWGRMTPGAAARRFLPPFAGGVVAAGLAALAGFGAPYTLLALFVCGFALVANVEEFTAPVAARVRMQKEPVPVAAVRVFRRGRGRFGGHIAHIAVIMAVFAIALSKGYKREVDVTLDRGETVQVGKYGLTFIGARLEDLPSRQSLIASIQVSQNGRQVAVMEPMLNYFPTQREPVGTPAIRTRPSRDLYLSLVQVDPNGTNASMRILTMPGVWWLWVAAPLFALAALVIVWPQRRRAPAPVPAVAGKETA